MARQNLFIEPPSSGGQMLATMGTTVSVFNINAKQAQGDPDNPYALGANSANVINHSVPFGANYLDLYHDFRGADPATAPTIRVFGRLPKPEVPPTSDGTILPNHRFWPGDVDSDLAQLTEQWIPLFDPTTGDHVQTFATAASLETTNFKRTLPLQYYVAGCVEIMVVVSVAGDPANEGMVSGRFVM